MISAETSRLLAAQERRRGRPATRAEQNIDVAGLQRDLEAGKERLIKAVEAAQRQAVRRWIRGGRRGDIRVRSTPQMEAAIRAMFDAGTRHARGELSRAGIRNYADDSSSKRARAARIALLAGLYLMLQAKLTALNTKLAVTAAELPLKELPDRAVAAALTKVLGARTVGARMASTATYRGLGAEFKRAAPLIDKPPATALPTSTGADVAVGAGWEYTAIMDGATCDVCSEQDGTTYDTWDDAQDDLPDGGPNPECLGGDNCRCRLAPVPPD